MLPNNNQFTPVRAERTWDTPQPALPCPGGLQRGPGSGTGQPDPPRRGSRGRPGGDTRWEGPIPPGLPRPRDPSIPGSAPGTARGAQRSRPPERLGGDTPPAATPGSCTGVKSPAPHPSLQPGVPRDEGHPWRGSAGPPSRAPQRSAGASARPAQPGPGPAALGHGSGTAPARSRPLPAATHRSRAAGSSPSPGRAPPAAAPQPCPPPAARD